MIIASQNLANFDISLPTEVIFRINLAWIDNLEKLKNILKKYEKHQIFLDLPRNRTKPPNNKYSIDELEPILKSFKNIKFLAISNIDSSNDLEPFLKIISNDCIIVPKIESPSAVKNIEEISNLLGSKKIIMLDHDDLYSSILKLNENTENFQKYIKILNDYCNVHKIILLRTVGVIFSDDEKRISDYVK